MSDEIQSDVGAAIRASAMVMPKRGRIFTASLPKRIAGVPARTTP
jgi:hypothetical protein